MTTSPILFDLDGTLIDNVYAHVLAWRDAMLSAGNDIPAWFVHRRIGMSDTLIIGEMLRWSGTKSDDALVERIKNAHSAAYKRYSTTVKPLPGAQALLAHLDENMFPWAIATSGDLESCKNSLALLGRDPKAITIVTRDDAQASKPDPDLFLRAAERLGLPITQAIVVGDSQWDMIAARRCGALPVGLLSGGNAAEELQGCGAVRIYDGPASLLQNLNEIAPIKI